MIEAAHEIVELARSKDRLTALDYFEHVFSDFQEFHGDRLYADDEAVVGGVAALDGKPVTVIGIQKGGTCQRTFDEILVLLIQKVTEKRCG